MRFDSSYTSANDSQDHRVIRNRTRRIGPRRLRMPFTGSALHLRFNVLMVALVSLLGALSATAQSGRHAPDPDARRKALVEPSFTELSEPFVRFRIYTDGGQLFTYDAAQPGDVVRDRPGWLILWYDGEVEELFVFEQLLYDDWDLGWAMTNLRTDCESDVRSFTDLLPGLEDAMDMALHLEPEDVLGRADRNKSPDNRPGTTDAEVDERSLEVKADEAPGEGDTLDAGAAPQNELRRRRRVRAGTWVPATSENLMIIMGFDPSADLGGPGPIFIEEPPPGDGKDPDDPSDCQGPPLQWGLYSLPAPGGKEGNRPIADAGEIVEEIELILECCPGLIPCGGVCCDTKCCGGESCCEQAFGYKCCETTCCPEEDDCCGDRCCPGDCCPGEESYCCKGECCEGPCCSFGCCHEHPDGICCGDICCEDGSDCCTGQDRCCEPGKFCWGDTCCENGETPCEYEGEYYCCPEGVECCAGGCCDWWQGPYECCDGNCCAQLEGERCCLHTLCYDTETEQCCEDDEGNAFKCPEEVECCDNGECCPVGYWCCGMCCPDGSNCCGDTCCDLTCHQCDWDTETCIKRPDETPCPDGQCCDGECCTTDCCGSVCCDEGMYCCNEELSLCCAGGTGFAGDDGGEDCCGTQCCARGHFCCDEETHCCPDGQECCGDGECCDTDAGEECCPGSEECCTEDMPCCWGTECCDPENCCGNGECCNEPCEGCIDHGALSGGMITVEPEVVCLGDQITFELSEVVDSGGIKRVFCSAKEKIPPVTPEYEWVITKPDGSMIEGSGAVATVVADEPGTYSVTFTATADRDCPPEALEVGPANAEATQCSVSLSSETGEPCESVELTLTGNCVQDCDSMLYTIEPQFPSGYEFVEPWLSVFAPEPSFDCTGQPEVRTVSVQIHGDAPPGPVPLLVQATTANGTTCEATGVVTVDRDPYDIVEVRYKTFIAPSALSTPFNPALLDFFAGDDRWFGYGVGPSRSFQSTTVTLEPGNPSGQIGIPVNQFSATYGYDDEPDGSDVTACPHCAGSYGDWCLVSGATADCVLTAVPGQGGNVLTVSHSRVSGVEVKVQFDLKGTNPCGTGIPGPDTPPIDADLNLHFRQVCIGSELQPMEFRLYGTHDGFPWHEVYVNSTRVYEHDPCCTGEGPDSLFGEGDHEFETTDLCHQQIPPLDEWREVPGVP